MTFLKEFFYGHIRPKPSFRPICYYLPYDLKDGIVKYHPHHQNNLRMSYPKNNLLHTIIMVIYHISITLQTRLHTLGGKKHISISHALRAFSIGQPNWLLNSKITLQQTSYLTRQIIWLSQLAPPQLNLASQSNKPNQIVMYGPHTQEELNIVIEIQSVVVKILNKMESLWRTKQTESLLSYLGR